MRLRTTAHNLADMMNFCYHSAVSTGRVHLLTFNADGRRFALLAEKPFEHESDGVFDENDFVPAMGDPTAPPELVAVRFPGQMATMLPEGIELAQVSAFDTEMTVSKTGDIRLFFFPDGTAEFAVLTLTSDDGDMCRVGVDGLSGQIEVGDVDPIAAAEDE
jgi:hypothetical protein